MCTVLGHAHVEGPACVQTISPPLVGGLAFSIRKLSHPTLKAYSQEYVIVIVVVVVVVAVILAVVASRCSRL